MIKTFFAATLMAVVMSFPLTGVGAEGTKAGPGNRLLNHDSPYLALHGNDPVDWYDWGDEAVEKARREEKLIFVSSGYFSCHWCHVMQRESYQNTEIAKQLNKRYISVKLDRELHPALDKRLMDFAQATQGRGGWPLNVYLTPDGFPVYAHMYQPAETFGDVLGKLDVIWNEQQTKLSEIARDSHIVELEPPTDTVNVGQSLTYAKGLVDIISDAADTIEGGFGETAKFPMAPQISFYIDMAARENNPELKQFLVTTLDAMANGGLRDHVGGGFFRYTTDPSWEVPHFEKMLYTNAMLAQLYLRAAKVLDRPDYEDVARDTWDFMIRAMQVDAGAMVASFSAIDDDNIEGGHYLWKPDALAAQLDKKTREVMKPLFGLEGAMMFPHGYLPTRRMPLETAARMSNTPLDEAEDLVAAGVSKLLEARKSRSLPTDTKLLTSWNGLALSSLAEGARTLNEPRYRDAAKRIRDYAISTLWKDGELQRAVINGSSLGAASIDDYAYLAQGLLAYARVSGDAQDIKLARDVAVAGFQRFNRDNGWYLTERSLIIPEQPRPALEDGALPSASAVMADTAFGIAAELGEDSDAQELRRLARLTLSPPDRYLETNLFGFATYVAAMMNFASPVSRAEPLAPVQ